MNGCRRELWGCGDGRKGQLGSHYRRTVSSTGLFRKLEPALEHAELGNYTVKSIAATWETSYVVLCCPGRKDVVISMGSDDYGDLGVGSLKKSASETGFHVIDFSHISSLSEHLEVLGVYSGQRHIILHLNSISSPVILGWGMSRHGQLGALADKPFASTPQIISIQSDGISSLNLGMHHTVIRYNSGELSCLGSDRKHQLQVVFCLRQGETSCAGYRMHMERYIRCGPQRRRLEYTFIWEQHAQPAREGIGQSHPCGCHRLSRWFAMRRKSTISCMRKRAHFGPRKCLCPRIVAPLGLGME